MPRLLAAKLAKARDINPCPPVPQGFFDYVSTRIDTIKAIRAKLTGEKIVKEKDDIKERFVSKAMEKAERSVNLGRIAKSLAADMKHFIISSNRR